MNAVRLLLGIAIVAGSLGCDSGPTSGKGFTLPDGNVESGLAVFKELRCYECHSVVGVDLPADKNADQTIVQLGGKVTRIKTYGELVTSVINPSHRLAPGYEEESIASETGESRMKNYNDVMTVDQLIDVVAFLQTHYELYELEPTYYAPYY